MIVGAGFGGLFAAKALRRADVEVTVIDRTNHHLFQPLLYQLATGILSEGDIAPPIRDILRHQQNASVLLGEVVDVDLDARYITVDTIGLRREVPYDSLIVPTGASQSYFGHPEFARDAPGMKTIDNALELRGRIFGAFEMAERETDPAARRRWLTFVIVGAGRVKVDFDCTLPDHPEVFVIGDLMSLDQLPGVAQVAIQSGGTPRGQSCVGSRRTKSGGHAATATWAPWPQSHACAPSAVLGRLRISGFVAWVLWLTVHLITLTGFKNRLFVLFNWMMHSLAADVRSESSRPSRYSHVRR